MGESMKKVDGVCFKNMVEYAVRNLHKHVQQVNRLNVFPVPDGDTGTNMVTTIHNGLRAVGESVVDLPGVSRKFARAVVFEARGNSGVIVSQFLKGISEKFYDVDVVEGERFIGALENGVSYAYSAVATPVEGTMLTVMKDATNAVKGEFDGSQSVEAIIASFIAHAKISLENTPELLAVLKESGVVDSGGAGVVYLFEGMKKYLDGEALEDMSEGEATEAVNYDAFNRDSEFTYGYCTELLLQLLNGRQDYNPDTFKAELLPLGDSLVLSGEGDKVRLHIHTHHPEQVFAIAHKYGEFLTCKIENMTVQHTETEAPQRIRCAKEKSGAAFAVIAVAGDPKLQELFLEMGADVALCCPDKVSTKDYLEAIEISGAENVLVFPNSTDARLSAMQAKKLCKNVKVSVLDSRTVAECYAALPTIDYEQTDPEIVADGITEVLSNLYVASVARGSDGVHYKDMEIGNDAYYAFSGKELLVIAGKPEVAAAQTIVQQTRLLGSEIITVFYRSGLEATAKASIEEAKKSGLFAEFFTVAVESLPCLMTLSFE